MYFFLSRILTLGQHLPAVEQSVATPNYLGCLPSANRTTVALVVN